MRIVKTVISTITALVAGGACLFLLYLFHQTDYLPVTLNIILRLFCVVGFLATVALYVTYLNSLAQQAFRQSRDDSKKK